MLTLYSDGKRLLCGRFVDLQRGDYLYKVHV